MNSIIATNYPGTNAYGTITDKGYNLSSDASINLSGTSTKNTDPKLGPLQNNGGPTATMALLINSPATNKISSADAPPFDQRGVPRPVGTKSDIGAFELGYLVSGQVTANSNGVPGVFVTAVNNSITITNITDTNGNYSFYVFPGKTVVTPSLAAYQFTPASITNVVSGNLTNVNFTTVLFAVSGQVVYTNNGLSGVSVMLMNGIVTNTVVTDTNGNFTGLLPAGTYTITPSLACYGFNPAYLTVTVGSNPNGVAGENFIAGYQTYTISGQVTGDIGEVTNLTVQAANGAGSFTATGDASGNYDLSGLCPGTYSVTPAALNFQFDPAVLSITVGPDTNGVNFAGVFSNYTISGRLLTEPME